MADTDYHFVRDSLIAEKSPPASTVGFVGWVRSNFFSSAIDIVLSLIFLYFGIRLVLLLFEWGVTSAVFIGSSREDCLDTSGACWAYIFAKFKLLIYGFYPVELRWRVDITGAVGLVMIIALALIYSYGTKFLKQHFTSLFIIFVFVVYPIFAFILLHGGSFGFVKVETEYWGGLLVTLVIAYIGIFASMPIGVVLALGRRSEKVLVRLVSIIFIEFWRGVPLITVLFMASNMLQYFLPKDVEFDKLLRVLIGVMLFSAAYIAEVVRGGLQAIPKGQYEASQSLGMNFFKMMVFIIMPQALKLVIPGIVNSFIALFKDTTLVLIVGLYDFLGMIQSTFSDPKWSVPQQSITAYAFAAIVYWMFCYSMSRYSMYLEEKLDTTGR